MPEPKDLSAELRRSNPDLIVYAPKREGHKGDLADHDSGNEHFLVFESPAGDLLAMWTQSSYEGAKDHRLMLARSTDAGDTWSKPQRIVGPTAPGAGHMASWGFPIPSASGRIYCFWNQYHGLDDVIHQFTGTMDCCYSDDDGRTWSDPVTIPMPRSILDSPDETMPSNWIVWQRPMRDTHGRWMTGLTRWTSRAVQAPLADPHFWGALDSRCEFMRFENIDEGVDPADLKLTWFHCGTGGLQVPYDDEHPWVSVAQEPSWVTLPDGRILTTMRTFTGAIWYSVSTDDGMTWRKPEPLRRTEDGEVLKQSLCCCPIYRMGDGRYLLIYHNNDGHAHGHGPKETMFNRRPAYYAVGHYDAAAWQPIQFGETKFLMDNDGVPIGPLGRLDLAVYTSYTEAGGRRVLWYPERKFFLLGKIFTDEMLTQ